MKAKSFFSSVMAMSNGKRSLIATGLALVAMFLTLVMYIWMLGVFHLVKGPPSFDGTMFVWPGPIAPFLTVFLWSILFHRLLKAE